MFGKGHSVTQLFDSIPFLRAAIVEQDIGTSSIISANEVLVSDGGTSDGANIQELFARETLITLMESALPGVRRRERHRVHGRTERAGGALRNVCERPRAAYVRIASTTRRRNGSTCGLSIQRTTATRSCSGSTQTDVLPAPGAK